MKPQRSRSDGAPTNSLRFVQLAHRPVVRPPVTVADLWFGGDGSGGSVDGSGRGLPETSPHRFGPNKNKYKQRPRRRGGGGEMSKRAKFTVVSPDRRLPGITAASSHICPHLQRIKPSPSKQSGNVTR